LVWAAGRKSRWAFYRAFPIVINTASGMREIDKVLISRPELSRVVVAMAPDLPARWQPIMNGVRLGSVSRSSAHCSPSKLSNRGIGYLIIQAYATFDAADVRAADRAVRAGDRGECGDWQIRQRTNPKPVSVCAAARFA
jgi:hypothetical protein